jgi:uncharacterized protein YcbK (DUF882 family)
MASVRDNLAAGKYANTEPYTVDKIPVDENTMTVRQAREHQESEKQRVRDQRRAWLVGQAEMNALLRTDLEAEHGMADSPKAEKLWELAWEHGHGCGYSDVISHYETFAELVTA